MFGQEISGSSQDPDWIGSASYFLERVLRNVTNTSQENMSGVQMKQTGPAAAAIMDEKA